MKLCEKLYELRRAAGLSQEELAERLNVSRQPSPSGRTEFPIVKDTTPNMTNPRLYIISHNKMQG